MSQQQVIWTALPNGRMSLATGEKLKLSVVVSPRLRLDGGATGVLGSFPDFVDWPAQLGQNLVGFDLIVDDDENHPFATTIVTADRPDLIYGARCSRQPRRCAHRSWRGFENRSRPIRAAPWRSS